MSVGWQDYLQFLLALIFVLGLIAALTVVLRRLGPQRFMIRGTQRRLSVVEVLSLDARRRLVLFRRDDRDHLILLGPNQDVLVESGIEVAPEDLLPPPAPTRPQESFQALLARISKPRVKADRPEDLG